MCERERCVRVMCVREKDVCVLVCVLVCGGERNMCVRERQIQNVAYGGCHSSGVS